MTHNIPGLVRLVATLEGALEDAKAQAEGHWRQEWVDARDGGWEKPEPLPWMTPEWLEEHGYEEQEES